MVNHSGWGKYLKAIIMNYKFKKCWFKYSQIVLFIIDQYAEDTENSDDDIQTEFFKKNQSDFKMIQS